MTGGYRTWPAIVVTALGIAGATAVMVTAMHADPGTDCAAGLDWVAVTELDAPASGEDALLAEYRQKLQPLFTACLDVSELPALDPAEVPDPRS